ncbi:MAG: hypothetical protein L3K24_14365, partial [Gammaproteobacteria bacterium]|nr:hypothetical protein [Gammaproteobacteria bacterium]
ICTMLSGGGEIIHKHATISMLFIRELALPETVAYFMGFRAGTNYPAASYLADARLLLRESEVLHGQFKRLGARIKNRRCS